MESSITFRPSDKAQITKINLREILETCESTAYKLDVYIQNWPDEDSYMTAEDTVELKNIIENYLQAYIDYAQIAAVLDKLYCEKIDTTYQQITHFLIQSGFCVPQIYCKQIYVK